MTATKANAKRTENQQWNRSEFTMCLLKQIPWQFNPNFQKNFTE